MNKRIIYTNSENKLCVVIPAPDCQLSLEQIIQKDVPPNTQYTVIDDVDLPQERTFRGAWEEDAANASITINIDEAKNITHEIRRKSRAKEFEPYDKIIALQIPGNNSADAETQRALIRTKYEAIQQDIDSASSVDDLSAIIENLST